MSNIQFSGMLQTEKYDYKQKNWPVGLIWYDYLLNIHMTLNVSVLNRRFNTWLI